MLLLVVSALCVASSYAEDVAPFPLVASPPLDPKMQRLAEAHAMELREQSRVNGEHRVTFRSRWVTQTAIYTTKPSVPAIQVEATDTTSDYTLDLGTKIILGMVKYIQSSIFSKMASMQNSLGIFSYYDVGGVTVFPEFSNLRDRPECKNTCAGACSNTCTSDGRKYDTLHGLATTTVAAVHEDTILCNSRDPYRGKLNVAVHEFAHSLHMGISYMYSPFRPTTLFINQIKDAYNNAYRNRIWDLSSYAMVNEYEYWAEGTGVYFNTDQYSSAGGMNKCDNVSTESCASEYASRTRLYSKDGPLYNALTEVLVNQNPNQYSNLKTCMK